jgi:hypothetical protein
MSVAQDEQEQEREAAGLSTPDDPSSQSALLSAAERHEEEEDARHTTADPALIYRNFVLMSILFSIHHGCVVSCLSLATSRLGASVGAGQSGILYLSYTGSALLGATYLVKRLGAHGTLMLGLFLYCFYVGAFGWAAHDATNNGGTLVPYTGAAVGGLGAGLVWTAQGSFFAQAASAHAAAIWAARQEGHGLERNATTQADVSSQSTARLAGVFAFFYLALELALRSLSSLLGSNWTTLFNTYAVLTILATLGMAVLVKGPDAVTGLTAKREEQESPSASLIWYQVTAALQLWKSQDGRPPVMPYMLGLNAVFGLVSAFLNAYVNGQVIPAHTVGLFSAWASGVAALWSLVFGRLTAVTDHAGSRASVWNNRKGWVLSAGALCFAGVVVPFVVQPTVSVWTDKSRFVFVLIYTLQGTGRATFEGTLKATFADFFPHEREGAFANIILQNGLASAFGFFLTAHLSCEPSSSDSGRQDSYCVEYRDGTYHMMGRMELLILLVAILAIVGYWRAAFCVHRNQERREAGEDGADTSRLL